MKLGVSGVVTRFVTFATDSVPEVEFTVGANVTRVLMTPASAAAAAAAALAPPPGRAAVFYGKAHACPGPAPGVRCQADGSPSGGHETGGVVRCDVCHAKVKSGRKAAAKPSAALDAEQQVLANAVTYVVDRCKAELKEAYKHRSPGPCPTCPRSLTWHKNTPRCNSCHGNQSRAPAAAAAAAAAPPAAAAAVAAAAAGAGIAPPPPPAAAAAAQPAVVGVLVPRVEQRGGRVTIRAATDAEVQCCASYLGAEAEVMQAVHRLDGRQLPRAIAIEVPASATVRDALVAMAGDAVDAFSAKVLGDARGSVKAALRPLAGALAAGSLLNGPLRNALADSAHGARTADPGTLHEAEYDFLQLLNGGEPLREVKPPRTRVGVPRVVVTRSAQVALAVAAQRCLAGDGVGAMQCVLQQLLEDCDELSDFAELVPQLLDRLVAGDASLRLQHWSAALLAVAQAPPEAGLLPRPPCAHLLAALQFYVHVLGPRTKGVLSLWESMYAGEDVTIMTLAQLVAQRRGEMSKEQKAEFAKVFTSRFWTRLAANAPGRATLAQLAADAPEFLEYVRDELECAGALGICLGLHHLLQALVTQLDMYDPVLADRAREGMRQWEAQDATCKREQLRAVKHLVNTVKKITFLELRVVSPSACARPRAQLLRAR